MINSKYFLIQNIWNVSESVAIPLNVMSFGYIEMLLLSSSLPLWFAQRNPSACMLFPLLFFNQSERLLLIPQELASISPLFWTSLNSPGKVNDSLHSWRRRYYITIRNFKPQCQAMLYEGIKCLCSSLYSSNFHNVFVYNKYLKHIYWIIGMYTSLLSINLFLRLRLFLCSSPAFSPTFTQASMGCDS